MEIIFEVIFQIIGELVLQLVFELLAELGFRGLREPFRRPKPLHPVFAAVCYAAVGAGAGFLSLVFLPHLLIASQTGQLANLAATPLLAGLLMSLLGAWRRRRGQELVRLDVFAYGFLFALAMALVRFFLAGPAA
jgi:hypothetical protein